MGNQRVRFWAYDALTRVKANFNMSYEQSTAEGGLDRSSRAYRYNWRGFESVSMAVVDAVADASGVDPLEVGPLHDVIDPDALDAIFSSAGATRPDVEVVFRLDSTEVTVRGTGEVVVRRATEATER